MCCGLPGASWLDPEQMHLTLRFIGDVDSTVFNDIREVLTEIRGETFFMQFEGVGFFPPRGNPRVVWAGIKKK